MVDRLPKKFLATSRPKMAIWSFYAGHSRSARFDHWWGASVTRAPGGALRLPGWEHAPVDRYQRGLLVLREAPVGADRGLRGQVRGSWLARAGVGRDDKARLGQQRLGGHVQRVGDQLEYPDGGLVQPAFQLAEVGVGQARQLRELPQRQVSHLSLGADEGAKRLPLRFPRIGHGSSFVHASVARSA